MKIYLESNNKEVISEYEWKGFRNDVYLEVNENYYRIYIIDYIAFESRVKRNIEMFGSALIEPNMMIAKTLKNEDIILAIKNQLTKRYFLQNLKKSDVKNDDIYYDLDEKTKKSYIDSNLKQFVSVKELTKIFDEEEDIKI